MHIRVKVFTVLLKSIQQSRVMGVLDTTNFATLSRITEALDEYFFVMVGSKFQFRGDWSNFPQQFLVHF
jgi:hypothetical protein